MSNSTECKAPLFVDTAIIGKKYLLNMPDVKGLVMQVSVDLAAEEITSIDFISTYVPTLAVVFPPLYIQTKLELFHRKFRSEFLETNHATDLQSFIDAAQSFYKESANADGRVLL